MKLKGLFGVIVALSFVVASGATARAQQQATTAAAVGTTTGQPASASVARSADVSTTDKKGDASPGAEAKKAQPAKTAPKPADKVGFARVSKDWPKWFTVSLVDRGRAESARPPQTKGAEYDGYYLNRFRLTASARMSPWFSATIQGQDARTGAYGVSPAPKSMRNPLDVRLAYVELGKKAARGVTAVIGRQEISFADSRLIASPDWGNVGRTYDALRVAAFVPGLRVEAFGAAPVDVTPDAFSRAKYGERVGGTWVTLDKVKPLGYVDVYVLGKHNYTATGETGTKGDQMVYTTGVRLGGPIGRKLTWEADNAVQRGHSAADAIQAWATHEGVSWSIGKSAMKPKVTAEYNYATGDDNAKDGTKQTFDQLYSSTHGKWGLADLVGWRNMHHVAAKFEFSPTPKLKFNTGLNKLYLAKVTDAWYGVSGSKVVINTKATSRDLGWEPDVLASYTLTKDLTVGAGLAVLLGGDFVRQSTDVQRIWTPYVMYTLKF